ncbi:MAG: hypothetical protein JWP97_5939 [Labilithrix sp.]|nr:hypothetical protein [Labilithrix sp.]
MGPSVSQRAARQPRGFARAKEIVRERQRLVWPIAGAGGAGICCATFMPRYVLQSHSRTLDLGGGPLAGTPVSGGLFEYEVTLEATVEEILAWPVNRPATKDRSRWEDGPRRSPKGDETWWVATNTTFAPALAAASTSYLTESDKRWLATRVVEALRANEPRYKALIQRLVADLLRRWTADAIQGDVLKVEAHWNDDAAFERLPSTRAARDAHAAFKSSRAKRAYKHEHLVPVPVLSDWLLALPEPSVDEVYAYLDRFCLAALVHEGEEALLNERRPDGPGYRTRMPPGWSMTLESDPWDRFKRTLLKDGTRRTLFDAVDFPRSYRKAR